MKQHEEFTGSLWTDPKITQDILELKRRMNILEKDIAELKTMFFKREEIVRQQVEHVKMNYVALRTFLDFKEEVRKHTHHE